MTPLLVLFADFITTEQVLASAVVGLAAVLVYNGFVQIRKTRRFRAAMDQPTTDLDGGDDDDGDDGPVKPGDAKAPAKPMLLPAAVLLLVLGVALLIGGIIWRIHAERQT